MKTDSLILHKYFANIGCECIQIIEKLINNQGMSKENLKAFIRISQNRLENRKVCLNLEVVFSRIKWLLANFSIFFYNDSPFVLKSGA